MKKLDKFMYLIIGWVNKKLGEEHSFKNTMFFMLSIVVIWLHPFIYDAVKTDLSHMKYPKQVIVLILYSIPLLLLVILFVLNCYKILRAVVFILVMFTPHIRRIKKP